uniref:Uncharacterized protein n=1 Tax=Gopherus evgoodei TaxID=1825980 RepID=A0A8C4YJP8_9SAUR
MSPRERGLHHAVLVAHGLLDAIHLLLVAPLVLHGPLLGLPQCRAPASPPRSAAPSPARSPLGGSMGGRLSSASSFPIVSFSVLFFSFSFSYFFFHCSAVSSRFTDAVFLMVLALEGRVDLVSASL